MLVQIIPQAVCSRYGLSVGAKLSVLVRFIVIILFPVAYPISKVISANPRKLNEDVLIKIINLCFLFWQLLDLLLGKRHSALLRRAELKTLVDMHGNEVISFHNKLPRTQLITNFI